VRRVPEVVEFYHSLMRRESKRDGGSSGDPANGGGPAATRDMIGEIENRSAHLLAVRMLSSSEIDYYFLL
jgi:Wiskott-Aldrich syndrome protein